MIAGHPSYSRTYDLEKIPALPLVVLSIAIKVVIWAGKTGRSPLQIFYFSSNLRSEQPKIPSSGLFTEAPKIWHLLAWKPFSVRPLATKVGGSLI